MRRAAAIARPVVDDPVLAALDRAPLDDAPETEEERRAVAAAKASGRMKSHSAVEAAIEALRKGE